MGSTSAKMSTSSTRMARDDSLMPCISPPVRTFGSCSPTARPTWAATSLLSPVIILSLTPRPSSFFTVSSMSSFGGSKSVTMPRNTKSFSSSAHIFFWPSKSL